MASDDFSTIGLLVLDVDGVLTDGRLYMGPGGEDLKVFDVRDGLAITAWKRLGGQVAVISGRGSEAARARASELGVGFIRLNVKDKADALREACEQLEASVEASVAIGDDLPDLPLLRRCAFSACPADAAQEVRDAVDYVAQRPGGRGCVREVVEMICRRAGRWDEVVGHYRSQ